MAETRTTRLGLVVYSEVSDSPSRDDWNEVMQQLELWAARDQGTLSEATPVADQRIRRFSQRDWGAAPEWAPANAPRLRTLYRTDDELVDWPVGGPVHPRAQDFRAMEGQGEGTAAWRVSHPTRTASPSAVMAYDGTARFSGRLALHDADSPVSRAALHVGTDVPASPAAFGRAYVRTVADGDRGLVVHPHSSSAAAALTVREPGGADQHWVDALGRVRTKGATALGGTELTGAALDRALTVSPASGGSGVGGMLVHGRSSRSGLDPFTVRRFAPGESGDATLLRVSTRDVEIGAAAHPDPDAVVSLAAPTLRTQGAWRHDLSAADAADATGLYRRVGLTDQAFYTTQPVESDNRSRTGSPVQSVRAWTNANTVPAPHIQEWVALRPGASPASKRVASIDGQGRPAGNVPHKGTGTDRPTHLRDLRQPLQHFAYVRWVLPGKFGLFRGPRIDPGDREYWHIFPEMTVRSSTPTQLSWWMRLEALTYAASPPFQGLDRVVINLHFAISINGGAWTRIEGAGWEMESVGMTTSPVAYVPGDSTSWPGFFTELLNPGDRFQLSFTARNSDGLGPIRLRRADLWATESIIDMYHPPFQPEGWGMTEADRQVWPPWGPS